MSTTTFDPDTQINSNKIMWWLLCTITAILFGFGASWGANLSARIQTTEDHQTAIQLQQQVLDERLSTIEGKLDILLERSKH
jgi:hypothetical protein